MIPRDEQSERGADDEERERPNGVIDLAQPDDAAHAQAARSWSETLRDTYGGIDLGPDNIIAFPTARVRFFRGMWADVRYAAACAFALVLMEALTRVVVGIVVEGDAE